MKYLWRMPDSNTSRVSSWQALLPWKRASNTFDSRYFPAYPVAARFRFLEDHAAVTLEPGHIKHVNRDHGLQAAKFAEIKTSSTGETLSV